MKPIKAILFFFALIFIAASAAMWMSRIIRRPVEWTAETALKFSSPPVLKDMKEIDPLLAAMDLSLDVFYRKSTHTRYRFGEDLVSVDHMISSLNDMREKLTELGLSAPFYEYVKKNYRFYSSNAEHIIFTGYYEASLKGSRQRSPAYPFPLYGRPRDLYRIDLSRFYFFSRYSGLPRTIRGRVTDNNVIIPYYSRKEIDQGLHLAEKNLELLWVSDPVDLFFLQIQGSGIVELDTGESVRVNYADSNGQPYRAVGRLLIDEGVLDRENASMQAIRRYLNEHPERMQDVFNYNPSYVFFREVEIGPLGSLGVPVTPFRSIATDNRLFPAGALCYIETELPLFDASGIRTGWKPFSAFVLNQDTGGAIKGPGRVDLFTGYGPESEQVAGYLKQAGRLFFLIKNQN